MPAASQAEPGAEHSKELTKLLRGGPPAPAVHRRTSASSRVGGSGGPRQRCTRMVPIMAFLYACCLVVHAGAALGVRGLRRCCRACLSGMGGQCVARTGCLRLAYVRWGWPKCEAGPLQELSDSCKASSRLHGVQVAQVVLHGSTDLHQQHSTLSDAVWAWSQTTSASLHQCCPAVEATWWGLELS